MKRGTGFTKFGARKTGDYASKKEAKRAAELKLMERAGEIANLREQVPYELIPSIKGDNGKVLERGIKYIADFVYEQDGNLVVEDVKGFKTRDYIIKRKLMLWVHKIKILET